MKTLVGADWLFDFNNKSAINAPYGEISGIAAVRDGSILIVARPNHRIVGLQSSSRLRQYAGNGLAVLSGDGGPAATAGFSFPNDVAYSTDGNVYVADTENHRIRRISEDGTITTIAGTRTRGSSADVTVPALSITLNFPNRVAADGLGNVFLLESGRPRVRRITRTGVLSTYVGNLDRTGSAGDGGPATSALISTSIQIAASASGILYISDAADHRIRKVDPDGRISTVAGTGSPGYSGDGGPAIAARLNRPGAVATDNQGNLYVVDAGNNRIRLISPDGRISTVAGNGASGFSGDGGPPLSASFSGMGKLTVDSAGTIYVVDQSSTRVRRIERSGVVQTVALDDGRFRPIASPAPALEAFLYRPNSVASDGLNVYISDTSHNRVRKLLPDGMLITIAGSNAAVFADGVPATQARLSAPEGLALDAAGNLFIADSGNHRIRKVDRNGVITTHAGTGQCAAGSAGDLAARTPLCSPTHIAIDSNGNLYVSQPHIVKRIRISGIVENFAGTGVECATCPPGDGGAATNANLYFPGALTTDRFGNVYIAEYSAGRIRKVFPSGAIATIAGIGTRTNDGARAIDFRPFTPSALAIDSSDSLHIAEQLNNRVVRITSDGVVRVVAGQRPTKGFFGDGGSALDASFDIINGLAFSAAGDLLIADSNNNRIRSVVTLSPTLQASSASLGFAANAGGSPAPAQRVDVISSFSGLIFSAAVETSSGGNWLSVSSGTGQASGFIAVSADPAELTQGTYRGAVRISAPNATPSTIRIEVTFTVRAADPPDLAVDPSGFSFFVLRGGLPAKGQLQVKNVGGGTLGFTATAASGGLWLSADRSSGAATPNAPAVINVLADPAGLPAGVFFGQIAIADIASGRRVNVPVTLAVTAVQQSIVLSQTGMTFTAVAGGGTVPPQTFGVINSGRGVLNWTARASTLGPGPQWLSVSPSSGSSDSGSLDIPLVEVQVQPLGLSPGDYYGQILVSAPAASNSPQVISIVLTVLPPGSNPGPLVRPTGLIFSGFAGGPSPGSQEIAVSNLTAAGLRFVSSGLTLDRSNWFIHAPGTGLIAPEQPVRLAVQAELEDLDAGIRRGALNLLFDDGSTRTVNLLLVTADRSLAGDKAIRSADSNCRATRLIPVFTSLEAGFTVPAGWPSSVELRVSDDCGVFLTEGSVTVTFSNGDVPIRLVPLGSGRWSGTWNARNLQSSSITVTAVAAAGDSSIRGSTQLTGSLRANAPPVINAGGIVNAASLTGRALAPGSMISIFGARLSESPVEAASLPLGTELGRTSVVLAGRLLPLLYASAGQINAIIPYDIPINARHQLTVSNGRTYTPPEEVVVAAAQPAVFTKDQSGTGQGLIFDSEYRLVDAGNPTRPGSVVLLYAVGLGATRTAVPAGIAAPLTETTEPVHVTIGDVPAEVLFAGLAPGFTGVYQINLRVPAGAPVGNEVPLTIETSGQNSPPVTLAIRP